MPLHILVLEENLHILELMRLLLDEEGYKVRANPTSHGSPELVKQLKPDLLIVDIFDKTPKLGWEFVRELSLDPATAELPFLVCTADLVRLGQWAIPPLSRRLRVITKPFELEGLLASVKEIMCPGEVFSQTQAT